MRLGNRAVGAKTALESEVPSYFAYAGNNPLVDDDPAGLDLTHLPGGNSFPQVGPEGSATVLFIGGPRVSPATIRPSPTQVLGNLGAMIPLPVGTTATPLPISNAGLCETIPFGHHADCDANGNPVVPQDKLDMDCSDMVFNLMMGILCNPADHDMNICDGPHTFQGRCDLPRPGNPTLECDVYRRDQCFPSHFNGGE
jgi:hypothetical protein